MSEDGVLVTGPVMAGRAGGSADRTSRPRRWLLHLCELVLVGLMAACTPSLDAAPDENAGSGSGEGAAPSGSVRLYVANRYEGVLRLDPATLAILDTIDTGPRPHGMVPAPDGRTLFITVEASDELLEVDVATHAIRRRVQVGSVPNEPTISVDGRRVFVPLRGGDHTAVVDTDTFTVIGEIPAGAMEHNAYTSANGTHVYLTSMGDRTVTVADPTTLEVVKRIPMGGVPRPMAILEDESIAYVALSSLLGFVTVDLQAGRVVDRLEKPIPAGTPVPPLDTYTHGMLLGPNERELWVAAYATRTVYAYLVPERREFAAIPVEGGPHWFALHPDGEPLYVTLENTGKVAAIHRGLREVLRTRKVCEAPTRMVVFRTPVGD
ncbi:MAG: hypothetical protein ACE5IK_14375 [Acidobacteriota bacterium]